MFPYVFGLILCGSVLLCSFVGVCCPEGADSEKQFPKVSHYPEIGNEVDDQLPVWGFNGDSMNETSPEKIAFLEDAVRPEDRGCGLATKQFPKITGGRPADPTEWPWMAALLTRGPDKAFCGGALITDRHVLTACHCTKKYRREELFVRLGEYDFQRYDETRSRDFNVVEIREHEDYDKQSYENDLAILKLGRPTLLTSYIWPV